MRLRHVIPMMLALAASGWPARADDVSDQIDKAAAAWRAHDSQGAIVALEAAANLVRQARAELLTTLLPAAPSGWTADAAETGTVSAAMLGGGTSAGRTYHNGAQQVQVQITTDSPMLQSMAALASSPLASAAGVKTVVIGGRSLAYTASDNSYMTLIGNKIIVKVDGSGNTPEPTVRSFVAAIDFDAVEKLTR